MNDPNAHKGDRLICGCWSGDAHKTDCALGKAEDIAQAAIENAEDDAGHPLIVAMVALANAGLLRDLDARGDDHERFFTDVLFGVLDSLWDANLLGPASPAVTG